MITIELFGVPRLRMGTGRVAVEATTVGEVLAGLAHAYPALQGTVIAGRELHPAYRLSLNGDRFVRDPEAPLHAGDCLILLAADVGG